MLQTRGVEGVRVLMGLLSLAKRYDENRIDGACEIALSHQAFRLRTIRALACGIHYADRPRRKSRSKPWWLQPDKSIEVGQRAKTALLYEGKQCKQTTTTGWF